MQEAIRTQKRQEPLTLWPCCSLLAYLLSRLATSGLASASPLLI